MSILQAVGIASQASDAFDDQRQQRRMRSQQEQMTQEQLNEMLMYREIVRMAYEHEAQQEQQRQAAKTAKTAKTGKGATTGKSGLIPIATVPSLDPLGRSKGNFDETGVVGMANGGMVNKFDGIYDDTKAETALPTMMREWFRDAVAQRPRNAAQARKDLLQHVTSMANGGAVGNYALGNGVVVPATFADGGKVGEDEEKNGDSFQRRSALEDLRRQRDDQRRDRAEKRAPTTRSEMGRMLRNGGSIWSHVKKAYANGGAVRGPGTGTSDSVPAVGPGNTPYRLSNGEYVLSADTVAAVGKHNLDALQARYHKPVK